MTGLRRSTASAFILTGVAAVGILIAGGASGESPPAPTVSTAGAGSIKADSALVAAEVNPNSSPTTYSFQYGQNTTYGSLTPPIAIGSGSAPVPVDAKLVGLDPGRTYHYRVVASNEFGTAVGADRNFHTRDPRLAGRFSAHTRVLGGGQPFGQRRGDRAARRYQFSTACKGSGSRRCSDVRLTRKGQRGKFKSRLSKTGTRRWSGTERFRGYCNNGLRFKSKTQIRIDARKVAHSGQVRTISGSLKTRVRGCVGGREKASVNGKLK